MADSKISALTAATAPLAGTEVLPIVQTGATVKATVANITDGRDIAPSAVSTVGNITLNSGQASDVGLLKNTGRGYGLAADRWIGSDGTFTNWFYNVPTGGKHYFAINQSNKLEISGDDVKAVVGNLVIGTAGKGVSFPNTTWLETVVASYKKSSSTTVAAGTGRSDLYFTVAANQTFTVTATGLGGLVTIVYGSAGDACTFFWSWNTATITILGNGGTMFSATSTPSAAQFGIYKSANSSVLSFKAGSSFSTGNMSVCLLGDYAASTTDPV